MKMEPSKEHIRHIILFQFHSGHNGTTAARNIQKVYGKDAVSAWTCRRWYQKFRHGDFSLKDDPREGRPMEFDAELLEVVVSNHPEVSTRELSSELGASHMTIQRHRKRLEKMLKLEEERKLKEESST